VPNDANGPEGSKTDTSNSAGSDSPHLDESERDQAAQHSAPKALVIHEVIREEGENELSRSSSAVIYSGFAGGLSLGFSFLALAFIRSALPDTPWRPLVSSFGYTVGFMLVVLGRQELFTESTLTAVLPLLMRRDKATLFALLRFWAVVLVGNLAGTFVFAALLTPTGVFSQAVEQTLIDIGRESISSPFWPTVLKSVLAGWLIALMVWLLPSARSARIFVIIILTYVVAIGHFSHIVAGSVEAAFLVFSGHGSAGDYVFRFLIPTLIGNTIGGVALVALLNHAPLVPEFRTESQI
jgi:formate/nitrite transporter FocA (FNT family)